MSDNIFFKPFATKHNATPFSKVKNSDFEPAVDRGIDLALKETDVIAGNPEDATFDNTIVALERSGADLDRVLNVFYPLLSAYTDDEKMETSIRVSAKVSDFSTKVSLNRQLWERVKYVYEYRDNLALDAEDSMLLQRTYDSFARAGATLEGDDRETYRKLKAELAELTTRFEQNVVRELATYEIWLTADDLDGLPDSSVSAAALAAKEKGRAGEYLFTLAQPTYMAFMKYSSRADLRERMYRLYTSRNTSGEYDNTGVLKRIAAVRLEIARLLGYESYADYKLERTMAQSPRQVYALLGQLKEAYRPAQQKELEELEAYASELEGSEVKLHAWDYSYYANKLKQARYSYDEEELRPYFELSKVTEGVFGLATRLYGLHFTETDEADKYHPDVRVYEMTDEDGDYLGLLYADFFPRDSKSPGAWMTGFKDECVDACGCEQRPHVSIVMNFTKPTDEKPSLLTPGEVQTFLHEFGHALHGLLAKTRYASMSGTSVYRDFVELPSQFNENYLLEKEFLDSFASHYMTGEPLPAEHIERIVAAMRFGAGYACLRQLTFGYLDMAWHTIKEPVDDAAAFETDATADLAMFDPVDGAMISPQFGHIFSGGYAAGYYSYKWAEVLDADAFAKFKANGIFDRKTAESFRSNILERGGTENPAELYRRFRGQEPSIDALLRRDGII